MNPFRLASFWAVVAGFALYLAQIPPIPGVILMMFGAAFLAGLLFHVGLVALFVEALIRRVPRLFAIVPILAYSGYYVAYFWEPHELAAKEAALRASTPPPIQFDGNRYSLVREDADEVIDRYTAPAVYQPEPTGSQRWHVHFLIPEAQCQAILHNDVHIYVRDLGHFSFPGACHVSFRRNPTLPLFEIKHSLIDRRSLKDQEEFTDVIIDGERRARYVALHTSRLPKLPIIVAGCFLIDSVNAWKCEFNFARKKLTLNPYPGSDGYRLDDVKLVGLHDYGRDRFRDFRGYPENADLLKFVNQTIAIGTPITNR